MKCPYCAVLDNKVIDSRLSQGGQVTRRRRECDGCQRRYTTYERVEQAMPLVLKRDGQRQPWDRMKVLRGLRRAVIKRPVDAEAIDRLVDTLERNLMDSGEKEVTAADIGEQVLAGLRGLDQVAYVRFASVYREFADLDQFVQELTRLRHDAAEEPKGDE
ncbi:MAG: transcriptional regulator NrdR [Deltaproteobacteria bacterium]|nr:MAG: transcriptional regulator NrdR [Deltaproteobacteria bacterium]